MTRFHSWLAFIITQKTLQDSLRAIYHYVHFSFYPWLAIIPNLQTPSVSLILVLHTSALKPFTFLLTFILLSALLQPTFMYQVFCGVERHSTRTLQANVWSGNRDNAHCVAALCLTQKATAISELQLIAYQLKRERSRRRGRGPER